MYRNILPIILMLLFVVSLASVAQGQPPRYIDAWMVEVDPQQSASWDALIKQRSDNFKEAGQAFYHVFQTSKGPLWNYLVLVPAQDVGSPPVTRPSKEWMEGMLKGMENARDFALQVYPEASTESMFWPAPSAPYLHLRVRTVSSANSRDYLKWQAEGLIPLLKEAKLGDTRVTRVALGGDIRQWYRFSFVDGWPDHERNAELMKTLGKEKLMAIGQVQAKGVSMQTGEELDILYVFRPDLSFTKEK